ncbi:hypothetical protein TH63_14665 [Rufibacter radiotolerans]|uniref:Uncharacterized protein n=1 Tax=Rufibacter radiotolerans TaxID=1379910 RepID=A0A0H4VLC8_9BACT|nr:hypothetical protein [Rufibacter radiotolerans]AKQ46590.1 hypothetical protein TH63_14665 [Rufibacter radiotolerans]
MGHQIQGPSGVGQPYPSGKPNRKVNMDKASFFKVRIWFTALVAIGIWSLLSYQHYHGGVPVHHILADENLPSFSNWWGALLLPVLTWILLYRIEKRAFSTKDSGHSGAPTSLKYVALGFAGALLFGSLLSIFFSLGYQDLPGYMLLGLFALALVVPVYRAQCLLGFVLGMTVTFGAVLPTGVGLILSLITAVIFLLLRPSILFVFSKLTRKQPTQA